MFEFKTIDTGNARSDQLELQLNECGAAGFHVVGVQPGRIILEREAASEDEPLKRARRGKG